MTTLLERSPRSLTASPEHARLAGDVAQLAADRDVPLQIHGWTTGPQVVCLEVSTSGPVRRLTALQQDLAVTLGAPVRLLTPLPGRPGIIGIEVPRRRRDVVRLGDIVDDGVVAGLGPDGVALGRAVTGGTVGVRVAALPHLLIAGATGTGKSSVVHGVLCSLLLRATPDDVRLILVDPKRVELAAYAGVPHLAGPIVTDPRHAVTVLAWTAAAMDRRYAELQSAGCRDAAAYRRAGGTMPSLIVVIDELADLMMTGGRDVETPIVRIAQLGRAAGVHLIVATQRPSSDVITGLIKANMPSRLALATASATDSRVILDRPDAATLLGAGDALLAPAGAPAPLRLQCALVTDDDVARVTAHAHARAGAR